MCQLQERRISFLELQYVMPPRVSSRFWSWASLRPLGRGTSRPDVFGLLAIPQAASSPWEADCASCQQPFLDSETCYKWLHPLGRRTFLDQVTRVDLQACGDMGGSLTKANDLIFLQGRLDWFGINPDGSTQYVMPNFRGQWLGEGLTQAGYMVFAGAMLIVATRFQCREFFPIRIRWC